MAITIKELLPSDPLSQVVDKINFNFDQITISGGGPAGQKGDSGPVGPAGSLGQRGSIWIVSLTGPTGLTSGINVDDKFLDTNSDVWTYGSTGWYKTSINIKGSTGNDGVNLGSPFDKFKGEVSGLNYVPSPPAGGTAVGNIDPNFLGVYNEGSNTQGIDVSVFGHLVDYRLGSNQPLKSATPRLSILQSNFDNGLMIGVGGTWSTFTSLHGSLTDQYPNFNKMARMYIDSSGTFNILGSANSTGVTQSVNITSFKSSVTLTGKGSQITIGSGGSISNNNIVINAIGSTSQIHLKGNSFVESGTLNVTSDISSQPDILSMIRNSSNQYSIEIKNDPTGASSYTNTILNIDSNAIILNKNSAGRVDIGNISSPSGQLNMYGSIINDNTNHSTYRRMEIKSLNDTPIVFRSYQNNFSNPFQMIVHTNDNIGIGGTPSDLAKFQVTDPYIQQVEPLFIAGTASTGTPQNNKFFSGWQHFSTVSALGVSDQNQIKYYREGSMVHISGALKNTTGNVLTNSNGDFGTSGYILTLPVEFRPIKRKTFMTWVRLEPQGSTYMTEIYAPARIDIDEITGVVSLVFVDAQPQNTSSGAYHDGNPADVTLFKSHTVLSDFPNTVIYSLDRKGRFVDTTGISVEWVSLDGISWSTYL